MYWFLNWINFYNVQKEKDIEIQKLKAQIQKYKSMISAVKHSIDCKCD